MDLVKNKELTTVMKQDVLWHSLRKSNDYMIRGYIVKLGALEEEKVDWL